MNKRLQLLAALLLYFTVDHAMRVIGYDQYRFYHVINWVVLGIRDNCSTLSIWLANTFVWVWINLEAWGLALLEWLPVALIKRLWTALWTFIRSWAVNLWHIVNPCEVMWTMGQYLRMPLDVFTGLWTLVFWQIQANVAIPNWVNNLLSLTLIIQASLFFCLVAMGCIVHSIRADRTESQRDASDRWFLATWDSLMNGPARVRRWLTPKSCKRATD